MMGIGMAVRPPRSRGPVLMMIDALRRIGGSLWMVDNALGDGAPNLLSSPEFAGGLADAPARGGLLTLSSMTGYDNAIAFGARSDSYAYKQFATTTGLPYSLSVIVKMDDGNAPTFGAASPTDATNTFALVIHGDAAGVPSSYAIANLGDGTYRVSVNSVAIKPVGNVGVIKYAANNTRTFKVTGYKLEQGGLTPYTPQSVLRTRGVYVDIVGATPVTAVADLIGLITDKSYGGQLGVERKQDFVTHVTGTATAATYNTATGEGTATRVDLANQSFVRITGLRSTGSYRLNLANTGAVVVHIRQLNYAGTVVATIPAGTSWSGVFTGNANCVITAAWDTASFRIDSFREVPGSHATQSAVASRPSVQRVNGRNVIQFDGDNDYLQTGITTGNEGWVCAGVTVSSLATNQVPLSSGAQAAGNPGISLKLRTTGAVWAGRANASTVNTATSASGAVVVGVPCVLEAAYSVSGASITKDGVEIATSSAVVSAFSSIDTLRIGAVAGVTPSEYLNGHMTATVYCPVLPSAADRKIIRNGIAALQGRTL